MILNKPEILAPCGNEGMLRAAIAAGADACYLAGDFFGARAYAENFSNDKLLSALDYAHLRGVKIYLTVNTLLKDRELGLLPDYLAKPYEYGLDGVLVQDFGVLRVIHDSFPDLPLHASTQMNITTSAAAKMVGELGLTRIVAAREMSLDELHKIKAETGLEVEAFVHGALCVCYSGRCLMSSMAGDRSGNRGRCAQPCRRQYNGKYLLSMKDLCTARYVPELIEAGVDSFKIEGRMKNEYYVACALEGYRELRDAYFDGIFTEELALKYEKRMLETFNRGGFTDGYLKKTFPAADLTDVTKPGRRGVPVGQVEKISHGRIYFDATEDISRGDEFIVDTIKITSGSDIKKGSAAELPIYGSAGLSTGTFIYRTRSKVVTESLDEILSGDKKIEVKGTVYVTQGEPLTITLSTGEDLPEITGENLTEIISVTGKTCEAASKRPTDDEVLRDKLIGSDEDFIITDLDIVNDNKSFIPMSELKTLRRKALASMKEAMLSKYYREPYPFGDITEPKFENHAVDDHSHVFITTLDELYKIYDEPDYIYADLGFPQLSICLFDPAKMSELIKNIKNRFAKSKIILALPFINRSRYKIEDIFKGSPEILDGVEGLYIRCIDDFAELVNLGNDNTNEIGNSLRDKTVVLAPSIYIYNSEAAYMFNSLFAAHSGPILAEQSYELKKSELDQIDYTDKIRPVPFISGKIPVMITSALSGCDEELHCENGSSYKCIEVPELWYNIITFADTDQSKYLKVNTKEGIM